MLRAAGSAAVTQAAASGGEACQRPRRSREQLQEDGRLRKVELQKLVNWIGIPIRVLDYPPGTSKCRIEHRLFSFII